MKQFTKNDYGTINRPGGNRPGGQEHPAATNNQERPAATQKVADELEKIRAMLTFMADTTDLLLAATMREKQQPMKETPYGMHLLFMELIARLDKACEHPNESWGYRHPHD
ncbi:MAG: hypothetical protein SFH39_06830 [Candidatus Magnetobacterium sp. LHC-1]|uniref:Uncharacterized protein n=1 Tax=Candidatus Magnetobacterium casense TaxID=1455061 RepID=A0ABS6S066_9BACT|nr:hypothetical protein [Candidatus Magnetobacterium casensis]MBF0608893.1 hypothetical protein [Nitrospirota bacterium]MBV6342257.1 hypothetical protein [Candidatus Magnetobacterium casensis]